MKTPLYFSCSSNKEDTVFAWFPFIWNPAVWDALYTNCLYVASTGTLSSVNSSLLWVIRNSTRNIDSRWDVLPSFDLSYDARVFTLGWCIFAPQARPFLWLRKAFPTCSSLFQAISVSRLLSHNFHTFTIPYWHKQSILTHT